MAFVLRHLALWLVFVSYSPCSSVNSGELQRLTSLHFRRYCVRNVLCKVKYQIWHPTAIELGTARQSFHSGIRKNYYLKTFQVWNLLWWSLHRVSRCVSYALVCGGGAEGSPGASLCWIRFSLFRQYHYLPTVRTKPSSPNPSHSATDTISGLV